MFAKPIKTLFCLATGLFLTGSALAATGNAPVVAGTVRASTPAEIKAAADNPKLIQFSKKQVPEATVLRRIVIRNGQVVPNP
ncbi:MAG: hypothetical protein PHW63_07665 [Alphaproteobacteria bacterium]|nr:hypothetical protein [Alphaproteobacteria bacterium]